MGSTRLPGKMMSLLAGRPLIDYALERLSSALQPTGVLDAIVLATSIESNNDPLVAHVLERWPEVLIVRGSEDNVFERFTTALRETGAGYFVRATGDCPFINVEALQAMVRKLRISGADIVNYQPGYEYVDKGLEAVSADALFRAETDVDMTAGDFEHVTSFLYRNPEKFNVQYIESAPALRRGDIRLTVDTPEDMQFFEQLFQKLETIPSNTPLEDVVALLDRHPELPKINIYSSKKSTRHESARLGMRCDGGAEIGMGHVVGALRMAKLLAKEVGIGVEFVVKENDAVQEAIRKAGFSMEVLPSDISPEDDVSRLIAKTGESDWAGVMVNFCKRDLDSYAPMWPAIKTKNIPLIFMDNPVPPSFRQADLLINALPHPEYDGYVPEEHPACYDGLEYFLAGSEGRPCVKKRRPRIERVLIAMGGGDLSNITSMVLRALTEAQYKGYVDVVLGAATPHFREVCDLVRQSGLAGEVNRDVTDLYERMLKADLGFTALGLTTYEMAHSGLPACIISNSPFNGVVADLYVERYKAARHLGHYEEVSIDKIRDYFVQINAEENRLMVMSQAGQSVGGLSHRIPGLVSKVLTSSD